MPVIQKYSAQQRPSVGSPVNATGEQFGAGIGRQLTNVAGAISQFGQDVEGIYDRKREREANAFLIKEVSTLQLEAKTKLETLKNEVEDVNTFSDTFNGWYKERQDSILAKAPNNLAKENFTLKANQLGLDLGGAANEYQARQVVEIEKGDALSSVSNIANTIAIDPKNFNKYKNQVSSIVESSKQFMTPAETQKFYRDANNEVYSARIMAEIDSNPYGVKNLLASEEYRTNIDSGTFQRLNLQAENRIESLQKEALARENEALRAKFSDPAKYAMMNGASSPQEMVAFQQVGGVAGGNISVLPKEVATAEAFNVNGFQSADEYLNHMQQRKAEYGDTFDIYMRDLKKNGLKQDISYAAIMEAKDKPVMDALFQMSTKGQQYKELAKTRGADAQMINEDVEEKTREVREVLISEGADLTDLHGKMNDIAMYFQSQGYAHEDSINLAINWFNEKIRTVEHGSDKYARVPDYINDIDALEDGLDNALDNITIEDIDITGTGASDIKEIQRNAKFILSPNQDYYYLKDKFNSPVLRKSDRQIFKLPVKDILEGNVKSKEAKDAEYINMIKEKLGVD